MILCPRICLQALRGCVQGLGANDWRADPLKSLINLIRSHQAYYGRLIIAPEGQTGYDPQDDFRVDLVPPQHAHGQGSQRDCFELFALVHKSEAGPFGQSVWNEELQEFVKIREGGLYTPPTPNEWHAATDDAPTGLPYMTQASADRARDARSFYDQNAGGGYR